MREALYTFIALMSHWRRHKANLATLVLGLAIATALWSGVQALNQQARKSYDSAARIFSGSWLAVMRRNTAALGMASGVSPPARARTSRRLTRSPSRA